MKRKFTFLTAAFMLLAFLAVPLGMRGQENPYSLTPDQTSTSSTSTSYIQTLTQFTYDGISWKMNQWNPSTLQVKTNQANPANEFRFYNTSPFPGRITQVVITFSTLNVSNESGFMFVGGSEEVASTTGGTSATWNSTTKTLTWTPAASDDFTFFAFYQNGKVASGNNYLADSDAIVVTYEAGGSPVDPEITFNNSSVNVGSTLDLSTLFSSNSTGAVTYSITAGNSYASIDESILTGLAEGSVTVEASQAATASYNAATATATITVNAYSQPTSFDIALNNTAFGCNTGNNAVEQSFTINNTVIVAGCASNAQYKTYYDTDHVRFYADSYLKITSPSGYKITKTVFTAKGTWNGSINVNTGTYTNGTKTWEGETDQLNFSFAAQNRIASIAITLALPSSIVAPTFDPDGGTYTTTQSVTISTTTDGATIYYTLDGTTPTSSSTSYSSAISVSETMTIKAIAVLGSDESTVASATYTILPILHAGTESDPYTVADARNAIDVNGTIDNAYVSGIISQVDGYDSEHHSITYWISDDGTTTNQLEVYSGKGIDGADFSAVTDVLAGADVTVKGQLKKYNNVYEFNYNNQLVSYTPPTNPSVTPNSFLIEALATSGLSGTLTVTYANITPAAADVWFCNAAGTEAATYSWIVADVNSENNVEYLIEENTGAARTAYFKVYAMDDQTNLVYSNLVTVNQAAAEVATLPFIWTGGTKEGLQAMAGVTGSGLGDNYAESNAPYRVKFDTDGDYILIKTNQKPAVVRVDIKKLGGANASSIKIQGSSDGSTFTDIETFSDDGAANAVLTHITSNAFDADHRYVKILFVKPSGGDNNVGVGPITIRGIETYSAPLVVGYGDENEDSNLGYRLIASPVTVDPDDVEGMTGGNFDLYWFDQTAGAATAWQNYEAAHFDLVPGMGYLYAHNDDITLNFTGVPYVGDGKVSLVKDTDDSNVLSGWNLIGNPFGVSATITNDYYTTNAYGDEIVAGSGQIAATQAVFVLAENDGDEVTFTKVGEGSNNNNSGINLNLSQTISTRGGNSGVIDRAIVRFGEGSTLPKFQLFQGSTKLYIPQNGKDYAVVRSEAHGEMPVNFKAAENGTYTISVEAENLDVNYLHLIDNMTGMDVDLLTTPSYTFEGKRTDYASRFKLVFDANENGNENEEFAFISDGNIVISNDGEATLQVIDMLGRIVSSQTVNGNASVNNVGTAGVYVLQLINGNNVKTQKIVVR